MVMKRTKKHKLNSKLKQVVKTVFLLALKSVYKLMGNVHPGLISLKVLSRAMLIPYGCSIIN